MAKWYQRGNQKAEIEVGQTIQLPQDTKGVIRRHKSKFWLPLWYIVAIVYSVLLQLMPSDYPLVICWPLYRLSYFDVCLLIAILVSFGHCIVCPTLIYAFWLPLCYLLASISFVLLWLMPSDYPFVFVWPVYRLSYFDLCLLITPLLSFGQYIVCPHTSK
jgi:hypothetical protein